MRKLFAAILFIILPSCAFAQCSGLFPAGTVCGSTGGGPPGPVATTSIIQCSGLFPANTVCGSIGGGAPGPISSGQIVTMAAFYAEKDGVDQTALTNVAYNVITFPSFYSNVGGYFDTSNNWWTPPAGYVSVHAAVYQTLHAASAGSPVFSLKVRRLHTGVTISHASPAVVTWPAHGLVVGQPVQFETSGGLPAPLVVDTVYYVIAAGFGANSFEISTVHAGGPIDTTTDGSGTQTGLCDVAAGIGTAIVGLAGFAIAQVDSKAAYTNGTDHFHVVYYYTSDDAGNDGTVDGNPAHTHFSGNWIGSQ